MKYINGDFPNFTNIIAKDETIKKATPNLRRNELKYIFICMYTTILILCFGLGYNLLSFHSKFIHAFGLFCLIFILSFIVVIPLHLLIHTFLYDGGIKNNNCIIGFNKTYLSVYNYYNGTIKYSRFIIMTLLPFLLLTILPLLLIAVTGFNIVLYAICLSNAILSCYDLYDIYIIIRKIPKNSYIIKSDVSLYFTNESNSNLFENHVIKDDIVKSIATVESADLLVKSEAENTITDTSLLVNTENLGKSIKTHNNNNNNGKRKKRKRKKK